VGSVNLKRLKQIWASSEDLEVSMDLTSETWEDFLKTSNNKLKTIKLVDD